MFILIIIVLNLIPASLQVVYKCDPKIECGCSSNPVSMSRVVGGENASTATWGWVVSLSIANSYLCGGSILSSSWIITAAHCVENVTASDFIVYAGSTLMWSGNQHRRVSQIIAHPNYDPNTFTNDIALLLLDSPLNMSDPNVSVICIPTLRSTQFTSDDFPINGTTVVGIGWGATIEGGDASMNLQQVTLTIIDSRSLTCASLITNKTVQFCAGLPGGGKDTCQGDSGGPLMMFTESKQWTLVGLTSFGYGCARPTYDGVYTRVALFESWIRTNTNGSYITVIISLAHSMKSSIYYLMFIILFQLTVRLHV